MDLKKISETFGVAVPFLILCACLRLVTYYNHWNIIIFDYLSPSELLFSFIQPGLIFILMLSGYFSILFIIAGIILAIQVFQNRDKKDTSTKTERRYKRFAIIVVVIGIAAVIFTFYESIWIEYEIFPTIIVHVVLLYIMVVVIFTLITPKEASNMLERKIFGSLSGIGEIPLRAVFIGLMITLASASYFYGRYEFHQKMNDPTAYRITLTDKSSYLTNNELLYLGKTADYYFLFDSDKNTSIVLPAREVKKLQVLLDKKDE